jgi:hypothetical protein
VQPSIRIGFAVTVLLAAVAIAIDARGSAAATASIALLQTFAVSSSFAGSARRGHYDLALTMCRGRRALASVHWAMSAGPGILAWSTVAALETASRDGFPEVTLSSGTLAAMLLVSTLPWALGVSMPRLTGGIAWLLLSAMTIGYASSGYREALLAGGGGSPAAAAMAIFVCPWLVVGRDVTSASVVPVTIALGAAVAAMALAMIWIQRTDVPLESAQ